MGTSKGYIAPSSPKWASAKRSVSLYLGDTSESNKKLAISRFANAMKSNGMTTKRVSEVFTNFVSFISLIQSDGLSQALDEYRISNVLSLPSNQAILELMNFFCLGSTIDDSIANLSISETISVFEINELEDFSHIKTTELIKELVCQFAKYKFAQMFDKQIRNKCVNVLEANRKLEDLQEYIYFTLKNELTEEKILEVNPQKLANETIILNIINVAFDCLEKDYD